MKKSILASILTGAVILGVLGIGLAARGNSNTTAHSHDMNMPTLMGIKASNPSNSTSVATDKVTIKDFAFGPPRITVKKGTKVTWTNQDSAHHDITSDQTSNDFRSGPLLAKGESYSYVFEKVGTYAYHCSPHPYMKATVEVTE